ncbi:phage protein Gp36 family protein [Flammeovirga sp. OC4]|uniref:phage protein Gp36 family protein n=1 Tax=Flammeovirga sp. OC4 TaxID=1382345 RepID=UPI0005C72693|nr:phage protein Gp36 family protein [Flammeovirga sp. OC4]
MTFIIPSDYNLQLQREIRAFLDSSEDQRLKQAEESAIAQMISYLNVRYDTDQIFFDVPLYDALQNYTAGDFCYFKQENQEVTAYRVYTCISSVTGEEPDTSEKFTLKDPRHSLIKMYCIDIALYHAYSAFAVADVPTHRKDRYDEAIEWLMGIADGTLQALLPEKENDDEVATLIRFGSHPKECHRY